MVLRTSAHLLLACLVLAACIHRNGDTKPEKRARVLVVLGHQAAGSDTSVESPPQLGARLKERLGRNGLNADLRDLDGIPKSTNGLIRQLAARNTGGPYGLVLIIETRSSFYTELEGRFRWTVAAKVSLFRPQDAERVVTRSFTAPAVLNFPHQGASEALAFAADPIAREAGAVAERFLAELESETSAPSADDPKPADEPTPAPAAPADGPDSTPEPEPAPDDPSQP